MGKQTETTRLNIVGPIIGWLIVAGGIFGFMCLLAWSAGEKPIYLAFAVMSAAFAFPLYGTIRA